MSRALAATLALAACGGDGGGARDGGVGSPDAAADAAPAVAPGAVRWVVAHNLETDYAPAIAPSGVIVAHGRPDDVAADDNVFAISPSGQVLWSAHVDDGTHPAPPASVVGDEVVLATTDLGAAGSTLARFALADGAPGATAAVDGAILSGVAAADDGTIYVPGDPLVAFGEPGWTYPLSGGGITGSNPAVGPSGTIYVAARGISDRNLYAVSPAGVELWKRDLGDAVIAPIAIDEGERIYAVNASGLLVVHDRSGELAWSFQLPSYTSGGGIVLGPDGTVYLGTLAANPADYLGEWVYAVRQARGGGGELVWSAAVGHGVGNTPALSAGGTLYVTDICRQVTALDAATGEERWVFAEPNTEEGLCSGFSAPAIGDDGTVYVLTEGHGDDPGGTYALGGDGTGPAPSAWPVESADPAHTGRVDP